MGEIDEQREDKVESGVIVLEDVCKSNGKQTELKKLQSSFQKKYISLLFLLYLINTVTGSYVEGGNLVHLLNEFYKSDILKENKSGGKNIFHEKIITEEVDSDDASLNLDSPPIMFTELDDNNWYRSHDTVENMGEEEGENTSEFSCES